jgi:hypothetical protein
LSSSEDESFGSPRQLNADQRDKKNQLMRDVCESPMSKQKYKTISRDLKEIEKTGTYKDVTITAFKKLA